MSELRNRKRVRAIRITILISVILLGLVDISRAADVDVEFGVESLAIGSDNIDRGPVGEATDGYLLSLNGVLTISSDLGAASMGLTISGGWETKNAEVATDSRNYHLRLTGRVPWTGTGYVEASASTSEGTAEPDLNDISQVRVRTKTSELNFDVGRRTTPKHRWHTGLGKQTEDRYDRDFDESQAKVDWESKLDPKHTLLVELGFSSGTEKIEGDEWTGSSALVDLRRRTRPAAASGYRLAWEGLELKNDDGSSGSTNKLSMLLHYEMETYKKWTFSSDLGLDGIKTAAGDRLWEPHTSIDLESGKEQRVRLVTSLSISSNVQDPVEDQYLWTRNSQARAAVVWSATRTFFIEPSAQYLYAELFGKEIADRTDKATTLGVEARWSPHGNWSVEGNAYTEDRKSSDGTFDLAENRIELRVSGLFK